MTEEYTLLLADSRATLALAGGKGASLARLSQAGLPVPDGFHVTIAAYLDFVAENRLQERTLAIASVAALALVDPARYNTLEAASHTIWDLFLQAVVPVAIEEAIAQAYAGLPGEEPLVAVRSSATAEDLPGLSFAGQQETYLNIHGAVSVLESVKSCWASLWTARAIGYRAQHGIRSEDISLAVVVQALVRAEASGVMFTANPASGRRDQVMITAARASDDVNVIKGFGASQGKVTATARVLLGPQDFGQMQLGDVLVAPITTPAWTPLFAMASAIVTDIGGPLSHSSIVAREYGLPAVLGTGVATRRIRSGQWITVDGSAGSVTLETEG